MPNLFQPGDKVRLNSTGGQYYVASINGYNSLELSIKPGGYVWLTRVHPKTVSKLPAQP